MVYSEQLGRRTARRTDETERAVADLKVEQKQTLSREEAARLIAALADGLGDDRGDVTVRLGTSTLELSVANQLDCELEVSVDGDEIELELELKWSISNRASAEATEDEAEQDHAKQDPAEHFELGAEPAEQGSNEDDSESDASAADEAHDGGASADAAESVQAQSARAVPADRAPRPRRGRRSAAANTGQSTSNGVDTAAVRAWAAANGLTVSPRGRIKDEVLQAYRDAGN